MKTISVNDPANEADEVIHDAGADAGEVDHDASSGGSEIAAGPHVEEDVDELAILSEELTSMKDRLLRQAAEFRNFRRRVEQERQADVKFGQSLVLQQLLDTYDDLRRSLEAAEDAAGNETVDSEAAYDALKAGVELVFKKFTDELQRFGVEPIEAVGSAFDEHEHEAMLQQPAPEGIAPGVVLGEIQKGYRMGDRVLRHAKVIVSA